MRYIDANNIENEQQRNLYNTLNNSSSSDNYKIKAKCTLSMLSLLDISLGVEYEKSLNEKVNNLGTKLKG